MNSKKQPVEIKSVCVTSKLKGKSVLYDFRLEKDAKHAPRLAYVFACHPSGGKGPARWVTSWTVSVVRWS